MLAPAYPGSEPDSALHGILHGILAFVVYVTRTVQDWCMPNCAGLGLSNSPAEVTKRRARTVPEQQKLNLRNLPP